MGKKKRKKLKKKVKSTVSSTGSALKNLSQGKVGAAGSDLLDSAKGAVELSFAGTGISEAAGLVKGKTGIGANKVKGLANDAEDLANDAKDLKEVAGEKIKDKRRNRQERLANTLTTPFGGFFGNRGKRGGTSSRRTLGSF